MGLIVSGVALATLVRWLDGAGERGRAVEDTGDGGAPARPVLTAGPVPAERTR